MAGAEVDAADCGGVEAYPVWRGPECYTDRRQGEPHQVGICQGGAVSLRLLRASGGRTRLALVAAGSL